MLISVLLQLLSVSSSFIAPSLSNSMEKDLGLAPAFHAPASLISNSAIRRSHRISLKAKSPLAVNSLQLKHKARPKKIIPGLPASALERAESFKTNFNEDFDSQMQVGACQ
jgi:hypothetical protein